MKQACNQAMALIKNYCYQSASVCCGLAMFFASIQPSIVFGSNEIVRKPAIQSKSTTASRKQAVTFPGYISAKVFGAKCDGITDDTAAFQKAVNTVSRIYIPKGVCLFNSAVTLKAGTVLRGAGMKVSIIKQGGVSGVSTGTFYANSGGKDAMLAGMQISNLTIDGQSDKLGFSEFVHLVSLNGVKDVLIENVKFRGFRGDGLYLGSGLNGEERHNENIVVKNSVFDGVNHSNRNGISIIDGSGVLIEGNQFINIAQPKMPGAIDVEPNGNPFHVAKDITIRNNSLVSIGGNVGAISFVFNSKLAEMPSTLRVEGNSISGNNTGIVYLGGISPSAASAPNHLSIINNTITSSGRSFEIRGAKKFEIVGNRFSEANEASLIGYRAEADRCMNGIISDNVFSGFRNDGLVVFSADYLEISRNRFVNIGSGDPGNYAIDFNFGTSSYIQLKDNLISAILGKTAYAIQKEAGHTFTPSSNTASNNVFMGVSGNAFEASSPQSIDK